MDYNMPLMNGDEATSKILEILSKEEYNYTNVIGCTAFEDQ